jgi:putative spermidine/putrescine transport system ATP-binding protein
VLLLDEPLGALDLKLRREMQIELKALQRDVGITFVFVTHDQEEALTMSDRIAVFHDGRIEQVARPAELYEQPATAFVASFVGTSNLVSGPAAERVFGEPGTFSVRPEKVRLHHGPAPAEAAGPDDCRVDGVVAEVVYLGAATHCVVDVGDGVRITVLQQNQESSLDHALSRRGEQVVLTWRREHVVRLGDPHDTHAHDARASQGETTEEPTRELR